MNKKVVILGILILLIILIVIYIIAKPSGEIQYSDNPADWVDNGEINIDMVTKGKGYINEIGQQYRDGEIREVFDIQGHYKGIPFYDQYIQDDEIKMRITNNLNPEDNIIDGYMTEHKEGDKWIVDIFVDADWKKQLPHTFIHWGLQFVQQKQFMYSEIESGIYHDQIIDNEKRFDQESGIRTYGIVVGDITKEDTANKTAMVLI